MPFSVRMSVRVPKEILSVESVRRELAQTLQRKTAPDLKKMFRDTTYGWTNKPSWRQQFTNHANELSERVYADGPNANQYALVNLGAPPHDIPPRNPGGWLRFRTGYRASTQPRVLSSRRNYRSGPTVFRRGVGGRFDGKFHPGFEARQFAETIAEEYLPTFYDDVNDAIGFAIATQPHVDITY